MSLSAGMTVRLPDTLRSRLDRISGQSGLKPSDLIRMAVESYCEEAEREGRIAIPILREEAPGNNSDSVGISDPPRKKVSYREVKKKK